jgi:hypothetical protein
MWLLRLAVRVPATLPQLLVNSAATLWQLCVMGPGAGRATGAAPITDSFDRSALRREALRCKGYRGAGNSVSTLGQLSVNSALRRKGSGNSPSTLRQGSRVTLRVVR